MRSLAKSVSLGGILTALALLFQSATVFLPGIGSVLSPFSTLPIALASYYKPSLGIAAYFITAIMLTAINLQESILFFFSAGLLGIFLGSFLRCRNLFLNILLPAAALFLGINTLSFILGIPFLIGLPGNFPLLLSELALGIFSTGFAWLWYKFINKILNKLLKADPFKTFFSEDN